MTWCRYHEQKGIRNRDLSLLVHHMPCTVPSSDAKNSETETSEVSSCVHLSWRRSAATCPLPPAAKCTSWEKGDKVWGSSQGSPFDEIWPRRMTQSSNPWAEKVYKKTAPGQKKLSEYTLRVPEWSQARLLGSNIRGHCIGKALAMAWGKCSVH